MVVTLNMHHTICAQSVRRVAWNGSCPRGEVRHTYYRHQTIREQDNCREADISPLYFALQWCENHCIKMCLYSFSSNQCLCIPVTGYTLIPFVSHLMLIVRRCVLYITVGTLVLMIRHTTWDGCVDVLSDHASARLRVLPRFAAHFSE